MRIIVFLLTAAIVPSAAATAQGAAGGHGPCSLVTKAEVQEAAGIAVGDGALNPVNKSSCHFKSASPGSDIAVLLTAKGPADSAEKTVAELGKRKIAAAVVAGLGDGAYSESPGYGLQQLGVYKGARHVVVSVLVMGAPEAKAKAAALALAKKALARM